MFFTKSKILFLLVFTITFASCQSDSDSDGLSNGPADPNKGWLVPLEDVLDGGVGKDGIPSIDNPQFIEVAAANYINDDELVIGVLGENSARAYPHKVLDWHEIVNDELDGVPLAMVYCPLTGTGTAWSRQLGGTITSFGVSGLLYQNNIIPYDRATDSHWSQVKNLCVKGTWANANPKHFPVFEVPFGEWKKMFPNSSVLSDVTGFDRNYDFYPYFDYKEQNLKIPFPIDHPDDRIPNKERVMGIVIDDGGPKLGARIYRFSHFEASGVSVVNDFIKSTNVVIAGSQEQGFMVAYIARLGNTVLEFSPVQGEGEIIMKDQDGNKYNVFGKIVEGDRLGQQLALPPLAFMGYWFAWGTFYPGIEIYGN